MILYPLLRTPKNVGLGSISALLWAYEKVGVREPLVILSPLLGTPEKVGVT